MNITRHNYEEYFILYLDNELSSEDRRQVELFVQENPDLKAELDLLLQSQLTPDTGIVFSNKEELLRSAAAGSIINTANYEEWLLLYADNELSTDQRKAVDSFIAANPAAKAELAIFQKTKLQPETIAFPDKQLLYRKEEKVRVVAIHWKRIAVAAALLLAVSSTALIVFNTDNKESGIASGNPAGKEIPTIKATVEPVAEEQVKIEPGSPVNNDLVANNSNDVTAKEKKTERKERVKQLPVEVVPAEAILVKAKEEKKKTNDLPQPVYNPNVNKPADQNQIAKVEIPVERALTNSKETNSSSVVTPDNPHPLDNVITASSKTTLEPIDDDEPGKKNKLRGFFRKVTRTFEKTTNIKATDEDRLLVGGLAIKL